VQVVYSILLRMYRLPFFSKRAFLIDPIETHWNCHFPTDWPLVRVVVYGILRRMYCPPFFRSYERSACAWATDFWHMNGFPHHQRGY
jgi:hypothetical protein